MKKYLISAVIASLGTSVMVGGASADSTATYPNRPITVVVPASVGGGSDTIARIFAEYLQRRLKQPVIVENRPGATGSIGTNHVYRAAPDGYTLLFNGSEFGVMPAVRKDIAYDIGDFTYLVKGFMSTPLLLASPKLPVNSVSELVEYMKANPGKATYGSTGVGGIIQLGVALFEQSVGASALHVPFQGQTPNYAALLGGHVDFSEGGAPITEGIKVLAATGSKRNSGYPDVPTLEEAGIKGATWSLWYGFIAPPGVPKNIQEKLNKEMLAVLDDPEASKKFSTLISGLTTDILVGDDFKNLVMEENKTWASLAKENGIVIE